jgi:hypothetical protein
MFDVRCSLASFPIRLAAFQASVTARALVFFLSLLVAKSVPESKIFPENLYGLRFLFSNHNRLKLLII